MKKQDVPQDNVRTYGGHKKVIYATNEEGEYETIGSSGWDAESFATIMAVDELNSSMKDAFERAKAGQCSPLEYHMYARRFDVIGLSQATGFYQWQIKRHFKPAIFKKLSERKLARYVNALKLSPTELQHLPEKATIE